MQDDNRSSTRATGRREALAALARVGGLALVGVPAPWALAQPKPACVVRPEQTEGPYFIDTNLERSDIRSDPTTGTIEAGVPLQLAFRVSRLRAQQCVPLTGAHVELWQCNARGVYSGVRDLHADATGRRFLRGHQRTDGAGIARFTTIYPGWYPGRTVHLHFMIRGAAGNGRGADVFTSQLYFDDRVSDAVYRNAPYQDRAARSVRNSGDGIFRRAGGAQLLLEVQPQGEMLTATFDIALLTS